MSELEHGVVSIGAHPDGHFISIGVVTIEQAQSEEPVLPPVVALQDVAGLSKLIHTLQTHLVGMIEASRVPVEPEPEVE
jgi:hypothetical protein